MKKPKIHPMKEMDLIRSRMQALGVKARTDVNTRAADSLVDNIKAAHRAYKSGDTKKAAETLKKGPKIKAYVKAGSVRGSGGGSKDFDEIIMQRAMGTKGRLN